MSVPVTTTEAAAPVIEYLHVLRRHRGTIVISAVVALVAALLLSITRSTTYESEVQVLVRPLILLSTRPDIATLNMKTEQKLAQSATVADLVRHNLVIDTPIEDLLEHLSVDVAAETEILTIKYTDGTRSGARRLAAAFADAYLSFRHDAALSDLTTTSSNLQKRIDVTNQQIVSLQAQRADATNPAVRASLDAQIRSLQGQLAVLQQNAATLASPTDILVGQIVEPAQLPKSPISPKPLRDGALGLLAGLVLGVGLALFREKTDHRLRGREDVEAASGGSVLAVIPWATSLARRTPDFVTIQEPESPAAEGFRALRSAFLNGAAARNMKIILVTSALPGEGKTVTVANLAVTLTQAGKHVAVVSGDLRRPMLHSMFGVADEPGLSDVLAQRTGLGVAVRQDFGIPRLSVVPGGSQPAEAVNLLDSDAMVRLLRTLGQSVQYVLVDTGPVLAVADAIRLAPIVDGIILVVGQGTMTDDVRRARRQLNLIDTPLLGIVLNKYESEGPETAYQRYYGAYFEASTQANGSRTPAPESSVSPTPPERESEPDRPM